MVGALVIGPGGLMFLVIIMILRERREEIQTSKTWDGNGLEISRVVA